MADKTFDNEYGHALFSSARMFYMNNRDEVPDSVMEEARAVGGLENYIQQYLSPAMTANYFMKLQ